MSIYTISMIASFLQSLGRISLSTFNFSDSLSYFHWVLFLFLFLCSIYIFLPMSQSLSFSSFPSLLFLILFLFISIPFFNAFCQCFPSFMSPHPLSFCRIAGGDPLTFSLCAHHFFIPTISPLTANMVGENGDDFTPQFWGLEWPPPKYGGLG